MILYKTLSSDSNISGVIGRLTTHGRGGDASISVTCRSSAGGGLCVAIDTIVVDYDGRIFVHRLGAGFEATETELHHAIEFSLTVRTHDERDVWQPLLCNKSF